MNLTSQNDKTRQLLLKHYHQYPQLQAEDIFKFLFQSAFGCEHLVGNYDAMQSYLKQEYATVCKTQPPLVEQLDGNYSRVHLCCLNSGLKAETLTKLFCLSAQTEKDGRSLLEQKLCVAKNLVTDGLLPLDNQDFTKKLDTWRKMGYPPVHHSATFRTLYTPAYRVIANQYANLLPLFTQIDSLIDSSNVILEIGGCACNKDTLTDVLAQVYGKVRLTDCHRQHGDTLESLCDNNCFILVEQADASDEKTQSCGVQIVKVDVSNLI